MPREFSRNQRLASELHRSISDLLRFEIKDPRLKDVSLTAVDVSRDLGVANVYFAMLDPDADPAPALAGLERASGFLRGKLGRQLKLRHVPELRFRHDESAEQGARINELIERALRSDGQH